MHLDMLAAVASESWSVLGQMAPYLLFGMLAAGVLSVCISPELIEMHLGGRGLSVLFKAAALGVPLPLCSCGVIPVGASLRRHGASRAATTSFLLATPETGLDSIAVTYSLLGPVFAAFRVAAALLMGLCGGLAVMLLGPSDQTESRSTDEPGKCTQPCCAEKHRRGVVRRALEYGLLTLPRDIGVPLLIGVIVAGTITALAPPNQWKEYLGGGVLSMLLAMAMGLPIYVCASASVPIAAGLMYLGASPGTALAFLIAGPATNAATISMTWKLLGLRTAALYLVTVAAGAVGGGLLLDWIFSATDAAVPMIAAPTHQHAGEIEWSTVWAVVLLAVLGLSYAARPRS